jgi:ABC-type phosphate transport system permease subunit
MIASLVLEVSFGVFVGLMTVIAGLFSVYVLAQVFREHARRQGRRA